MLVSVSSKEELLCTKRRTTLNGEQREAAAYRIADMVSAMFVNGGHNRISHRLLMPCVVSANSLRCNRSFSRRDNACGKH